jgi:hypothetical protein
MPYPTTALYLEELVSQHTRLLHENPMAVLDKDECREEYRCLHTIKTLTKQLVTSAGCNGPFKLFLDDLRFGNILVDAKSFEIKALIDWEFCYSAPRQFLLLLHGWYRTPILGTGYLRRGSIQIVLFHVFTHLARGRSHVREGP